MGILWPKSGQIEFDNNGERAGGALAYFYAGATTTPLTVYQDADESTPHEHPVEAASNGRYPAIYIPYTASYDVRVTTEGGTGLFYYTEIPNLDPIEASEDSIDEEALLAVGDVVWSPVAGTRAGFVRLNGRTMGSGASGATERANDDTEDLFTFLWNALGNTQAPVSTGRGGSAAADFAANKTITLLDGRAALLGGVDDMGNSAAGLLASAPVVNGAVTTVGSILGSNTQTLTTANLASHTHTGTTGGHSASHSHDGTTSTESAPHTHTYDRFTDNGNQTNLAVGGAGVAQSAGDNVSTASGAASASHTHSFTSGAASADHTHDFTSNASGSGSAHNNFSRSLLGTFYQKL